MPIPSIRQVRDAGPQSIADVCTTSGTNRRRFRRFLLLSMYAVSMVKRLSPNLLAQALEHQFYGGSSIDLDLQPASKAGLDHGRQRRWRLEFADNRDRTIFCR